MYTPLRCFILYKVGIEIPQGKTSYFYPLLFYLHEQLIILHNFRYKTSRYHYGIGGNSLAPSFCQERLLFEGLGTTRAWRQIRKTLHVHR
jgi:hypothetical protein